MNSGDAYSFPQHRVFEENGDDRLTENSPTAEKSEAADDSPRPRIVGLETEYTVLYIPAVPGVDERPPFLVIQEIIFDLLLRGRRAANAELSKEGYFLSNGGLVHMEIFLREQEDTPILEMATPETRSAWDTLVYSRAFDLILEEISRRSSEALLENGFDGYISFGKNNRDSRGIGFGSHENYSVYHSPTLLERTVFIACAPFVILALLPALIFVVLLLLGALLGCLIALPIAAFAPKVLEKIAGAWDSLRANRRVWRQLVGIARIGPGYLLVPGVALHTRVLRRTALKPFFRNLAPFLASRSALCGTGRLNFEDGVFETSQRASMVKTLSNIVIFSGAKMMFDLKQFHYRPRSFFRSQKKLTVTSGDTNLSDVPLLLRMGTTALLLEMIEAGESFDELALRNPIRSLHEWSRGDLDHEERLKDGSRMTALQMQRAYYKRALVYYEMKVEADSRHVETLALWNHVLSLLERDPSSAAHCVEWVAKKQILDEAVDQQGSWSDYYNWGRLFSLTSIEEVSKTRSIEDLLMSIRPGPRRRARRWLQELTLSDFADWKNTYLQTRKIELRFHELSSLGGYQRALENSGLIQKLTLADDVERATKRAPPNTRARLRGYFIQLAQRTHDAAATWEWVRTPYPSRLIRLDDPFKFDLT